MNGISHAIVDGLYRLLPQYRLNKKAREKVYKVTIHNHSGTTNDLNTRLSKRRKALQGRVEYLIKQRTPCYIIDTETVFLRTQIVHKPILIGL
ncbi:hypothetical protein [Marinomonas arenicola]|uniref:Transposase n=1 Tax=Marinomonas arenicola TaxID=569601 RepID=A0ABU9G3D1_9GAMM